MAMVRNTAKSPITLPVARGALIALHFPSLLQPVVNVATDGGSGSAHANSWLLAAVLSVSAVGLQLRHSLAVADGRRPAAWPLTLSALTLIAVLPLPWWGINWAVMLLLVGASSLMLLPRSTSAWIIVGILIAGPVASWRDWQASTTTQFAYWIINWMVATFTVTVVLPAGAALVRVLADVRATHARLAEQAVQMERIRVGRDLHDLIGQSLSAVSLKGDLALRLLPADPDSAGREIASLSDAARAALRQVRDIPKGQPTLSLRQELDGGAALLAAAGVAVALPDPLPALPAEVGQVLAWAVREGTTNVLRHSDATAVKVSIEVKSGWTRLELRNNRPHPGGPPGSGLRGLEHRAAEFGGTVAGRRQRDGWFVLRVDLPPKTPRHD